MTQKNNSTALAPFRYRDFCVFWTGSFLSSIGTQFTTVAMAWQIYELTNSPLQIGLLGLARALPQIFLLLVGGLLADAIDRRKLMMCTQSGLFCVSTSLALLSFFGKASPHMLYAATMFLAIFTSLEQPSRQSMIPNLVPRANLAQALALQGTQRYVPIIAGPSLAGVVLAFSGPAACYAVDACSWLAMLSALRILRAKVPEGGGWKTISFESLRQGFQFVWSHGVIFPLMVLDFSATFFGNARGLFPIFARDILFVGPKGLGLLYASRAVGSLFAAIGMTMLGPVRRGGRWIIIGITIYGLSTAIFAQSRVFWFSVLMLALTGVGDTISSILRSTINQLSTPDELRGRMSSINSIFTSNGPQLGQFESGLVAAWFGAEVSALTGGLATLLILGAVAAAYPIVRQFRIEHAKQE
ncbi:MAG TPA: MFS transporter [Acidobacteriota bacterium]|nr:MFS transporter [Acidobacteriota bacterium]